MLISWRAKVSILLVASPGAKSFMVEKNRQKKHEKETKMLKDGPRGEVCELSLLNF